MSDQQVTERPQGHASNPEQGRGDDAAPLKPLELLRWVWRQLTSMRTALILLFLLALGAIPGSVVPQEAVDSLRTSQWQDQHPHLTPIYEKLGLFSVYDSVWFSAIYLLLMVSLVGCILPRSRVYWRQMRARPPRAPRNLARFADHRSWTSEETPEQVVERAHALLRRRRYRVDTDPVAGEVASERGYLREAGNLVFHLSILIVLAGFALGSLLGFKGGVIVVTGESFANTVTQYDDFRPGGLFSLSRLAPFSLTVKDFDLTFIRSGRQEGTAEKFSAGLDYRSAPGAAEEHTRISVNHPLTVDGTKVYLISHGYAPRITVRDGTGQIAYRGPVVFLPEDATFRSFGVVKAPYASPQQIGLQGEFYPTYAFVNGNPLSAFPDLRNPALSLSVYAGDLGLGSGAPQSVYALDKRGLTELKQADGRPMLVDLTVGQTKTLPDGLGSVRFDGVDRFVKLQVSRNPGDLVALGGISLALLGLLGSLFLRPRRVWVRARRGEDGRTLVEVAGLDRSSGGDLSGELETLTRSLRPSSAGEPPAQPPGTERPAEEHA